MGEEYYWDEIQGIGKLYVDIELVVGLEPVLFVCTVEGDVNKKYLVMTYDSCNGIYILRKIDNKELLDMLENRVTMERTFRNSASIFKTYIDESDNLRFKIFEGLTFDEKFLPRKNEFFELKSRHILKYIEKIKREEKNMQYKPCKLGSMSVLYTPKKICNMDHNYPEVIIMPDNCENNIKWGLLNLGYSINSYPLESDNYEEISLPKINLGMYNVNNLVLGKEICCNV